MKIAKNVLGTSGKRKHKLKEQLDVYHVLLCCTIIMKIYEISHKNHFLFFPSNFHAALNYICIKIMENITTTKNIFINMKSNFTVTISF